MPPPSKEHRTVLLQLYRSLLRLGNKFDKSPMAKAMIYIKNPVSPSAMNNVTAQYYVEVLGELLRQKQFYHPSASSSSPQSLESDESSIRVLIKKHFRLKEHIASTTFRIDTGFSIMRKLTNIWRTHLIAQQQEGDGGSGDVVSSVSTGRSTEKVDRSSDNSDRDSDGHGSSEKDREVFKKKVAVEMINELSKGVILVSHPLLNGPLYRSVILLLEHSEHGSYGVVINKPTSHTVKSAVVNLPMELLKQFGETPVFFGGPVRRLQYLHSVPSCGGSKVPNCTRPMFAGGSITKALSLVRRNKHLVSNFKFFVGCCTWEASQLQDEIERGVWLTVKAHSDELVSLLAGSQQQQHQQQQQSQEVPTAVCVTSQLASQQQVDTQESPLKKMVTQLIGDNDVNMAANNSEIVGKDDNISARNTEIAENKAAILFEKQLQYSQRFKTEPELMNKTLREDLWQVIMNSLGPNFDCFAKMKKSTSFLSVEPADWR